MKNVLSIAGFDPSGGAGVLADIKTFNAFGENGFGVTTSITFQNAYSFEGVNWLSFEQIEKQLSPLAKEEISVVKIGLIESISQLDKIIDLVNEHHPDTFIVWDPILSASAGFTFHSDLNGLEQILAKIDCITPNKPELAEIQKNLSDKYTILPPTKSMILKGGHDTGNKAIDEIWIEGELQDSLVSDRLDGSIHGSGCVLSSALSANIAKGLNLKEALLLAKEYVFELIDSQENNLAKHYLVQV